MFKSILAAALITSALATGAMAATPTAKVILLPKHTAAMVHKVSMKKAMLKMHHCAKGQHSVKGKCVK